MWFSILEIHEIKYHIDLYYTIFFQVLENCGVVHLVTKHILCIHNLRQQRAPYKIHS